MNLRFVETFLWVCRLGSFRAAAARLNTTQAAVSNRIATLEQELGNNLFERTPGAVHLTLAGKRAIPHAEQLLRTAELFREAAGEPANLTGLVSIGTIDSIVHTWLHLFVERIRARYPSIALDFDVDTSMNIAQAITAQKVDLALLMGPVPAPGLRNLPLTALECQWVAGAEIRKALPEGTLGLETLAQFPIFAFARGSVPHSWLIRQFEDRGLRVPTTSHSNSLSTIMRLISDGMGVGALPTRMIQRGLAEGRLFALNVDPGFPPLQLHAVFADHADNLISESLAQIAREVSAL
ncbi:LysR family transcriptional regulator [Paracoccus pacificus]|uniref:LysR family transcriptional regulator n=1 Tax=Paracoccus pacificus TaxID=1463598 RepID=A0ABW4R2N7_9RHOB